MKVRHGKFAAVQAAWGGNRFIGRQLWRGMESAALQNLELGAVVAHSDAIGIESLLPQLDQDRLIPLVKAGLISQAQIESLRIARERFLRAGNPFILTISLVISGEKAKRYSSRQVRR